MRRFDSLRLSVHPVEPRAAGPVPTVRPRGRGLSVVLTNAMNAVETAVETDDGWPPTGTVSQTYTFISRPSALCAALRTELTRR
jgi:hypothetical protein